jgi:hypothetical protein
MNSLMRVAAVEWMIVAVLFTASITAFQTGVTLRYRWTKGETLRYRMTQESSTAVSGLPDGIGDTTVDQTMTQVFRVVVEDVAADGTTTVQQTLESFRMEMNTPMGKTTYDSASADTAENPSTASYKRIFSAIVGEPFTLVLSPTGSILKLEGFSRIREKMFSALPQDAAGVAVANALKATFNDDDQTIGHWFLPFSDRAVKVGDTWNTQATGGVAMFGSFTTSMAATLKAIEGIGADQVARIATQMTIKRDPTESAKNPMGLSMQIGDSTGEGEILFDITKGRLLQSTTRRTMPMTMSGPGPDGTPMTMKSNVKSATTVELIQQ